MGGCDWYLAISTKVSSRTRRLSISMDLSESFSVNPFNFWTSSVSFRVFNNMSVQFAMTLDFLFQFFQGIGHNRVGFLGGLDGIFKAAVQQFQ